MVLTGICFFFIVLFSFPVFAEQYTINLDIKDEEDFDQLLNITVYEPGTNEVLYNEFASGSASFELNSSKVDFEMNFDDTLVLLLQNLLISNMDKKIIINYELPFMEDYEPIKGYIIQLPDFNFDNAVMKIRYDDVSVNDENKMQLVKCSNYDFTSFNCSDKWESVPITVDKNEKIVMANVKSFSVYVLVEPLEAEIPSATTTQTTSTANQFPIQTTTTQSSSPNYSDQTTTTTLFIQENNSPSIVIVTQKTNQTIPNVSNESSTYAGMSDWFSNSVVLILILVLIFSGVLSYKRYSESVKRNKIYKKRKMKERHVKETKLSLK